MSEEPPSWQKFKNSIESNAEYHRRLAIALNHRTRTRILEILLSGPLTLEEISSRAELSREKARLHLDILKHGFCVAEREGKFSITPEGTVVKRFRNKNV